MPFVFECGTCHSRYRIDETQLPQEGAKITCSKCLSFFFLYKGGTASAAPMIEHLVLDGAYEVNVPPPGPNEVTTDQLLNDLTKDHPLVSPTKEKTDKIIPPPLTPISSSSAKPISSPIGSRPTPSLSSKTNTPVVKKELPSSVQVSKLSKKSTDFKDVVSEFPEDRLLQVGFEKYLVLLALIMIVLCAILFLNYQRILLIPGLENLRIPIAKKGLETPTFPAPTLQGTVKPKYGFPVIEEKGSPSPQSENPRKN